VIVLDGTMVPVSIDYSPVSFYDIVYERSATEWAIESSRFRICLPVFIIIINPLVPQFITIIAL